MPYICKHFHYYIVFTFCFSLLFTWVSCIQNAVLTILSHPLYFYIKYVSGYFIKYLNDTRYGHDGPKWGEVNMFKISVVNKSTTLCAKGHHIQICSPSVKLWPGMLINPFLQMGLQSLQPKGRRNGPVADLWSSTFPMTISVINFLFSD